MENAKLAGKTPSQSLVIMTELVLPSQINLLNNLLGGQLMHMMDIAGSLVCKRHSGLENATVAVDNIEFKHPVKLGDIITITAKMVWAGRTSMKVKMKVTSEDVIKNTSLLTNTAFFTFVALDSDAKPAQVPLLLPETEEEKADYQNEQQRYLCRKS